MSVEQVTTIIRCRGCGGTAEWLLTSLKYTHATAYCIGCLYKAVQKYKKKYGEVLK